MSFRAPMGTLISEDTVRRMSRSLRHLREESLGSPFFRIGCYLLAGVGLDDVARHDGEALRVERLRRLAFAGERGIGGAGINEIAA